jgi:hypothetical protein
VAYCSVTFQGGHVHDIFGGFVIDINLDSERCFDQVMRFLHCSDNSGTLQFGRPMVSLMFVQHSRKIRVASIHLASSILSLLASHSFNWARSCPIPN